MRMYVVAKFNRKHVSRRMIVIPHLIEERHSENECVLNKVMKKKDFDGTFSTTLWVGGWAPQEYSCCVESCTRRRCLDLSLQQPLVSICDDDINQVQLQCMTRENVTYVYQASMMGHHGWGPARSDLERSCETVCDRTT